MLSFPRNRLATSHLLPVVALLLTVVTGSPSVADTQRKLSDPAKADALIQGLRSPSFRVRLQAETDCRQSGDEMLPSLNAALKSSDPELRRRARFLIERIENDLLSDSLNSFLQPGSRASLPGWTIVEDLVEDTPEVRAAYAGILKGNPELSRALVHSEDIPNEIQRQLQSRNLLGTIPRTISPADTSGLLLLLIHPEANYSADLGEVASRMVWAGVSHAEIDVETLRNPSRVPSTAKNAAVLEILRALVTRWVTIPKAGTPHDRLLTATRLGLPEAVAPALEIIKQKDSPHVIGTAFVAIANYGGANEMAIVESKLDDEFELSPSRKNENDDTTPSTQLRDVALATLIEMTRQAPEQYGMKKFPRDAEGRVSAFPVTFESNEQRDLAFEKWRAWSRINLRKYRPLPQQAAEGTPL